MQDKEALNLQLNPDPLLDVPQTAQFFGSTERHVRHLISKQEIAVTRIGSKVRIRYSVLTAYVSERTTPAKGNLLTLSVSEQTSPAKVGQ